MKNKIVYAQFNLFEIALPQEAVDDCSRQGRCDEDVAYWQPKLNLNLDRESMILELKEYGAWSTEELKALDNSELEQNLIWIAACNIKEEQFLEGNE